MQRAEPQAPIGVRRSLSLNASVIRWMGKGRTRPGRVWHACEWASSAHFNAAHPPTLALESISDPDANRRCSLTFVFPLEEAIDTRFAESCHCPRYSAPRRNQSWCATLVSSLAALQHK